MIISAFGVEINGEVTMTSDGRGPLSSIETSKSREGFFGFMGFTCVTVE